MNISQRLLGDLNPSLVPGMRGGVANAVGACHHGDRERVRRQERGRPDFLSKAKMNPKFSHTVLGNIELTLGSSQ